MHEKPWNEYRASPQSKWMFWTALILAATLASPVRANQLPLWRPATLDGHQVEEQSGWQGLSSLQMESQDGGERRWMRTYEVLPNSVYSVFAQARAESSSGNLSLNVRFYGTKEGAMKAAYTPHSTTSGTIKMSPDWQFAAHTFRAPRFTHYTVVECAAGGLNGKAWFSNVQLTKEAAVPIPLQTQPPLIDGMIAAGEWDQAMLCRGFIPTDYVPDLTEYENTCVRVTLDNGHIYFAVECSLQDRNASAPVASGEELVECFFATGDGPAAPAWRMALDLSGKVTLVDWPAGQPQTTNGLHVVFARNASGVTVEASIALQSLAVGASATLGNQTVRKLALQRWRRFNDREERSVWSREFLDTRLPWVWTHVEPIAGATGFAVRFDGWSREDPDFWGIVNDQYFATEPLYRELLSDAPRRLQGYSGFVWRFPYSDRAESEAVRFGMTHDREQIMRDSTESGLALYEYYTGLLDNSMYRREEKAQQARERADARVTYCAAYHPTANRTKLPHSPGFPFDQKYGRQLIFDPAVEAWSLADLETTIRTNKNRLSSVMLGDEVFVMQLEVWPEYLKAWHKGDLDYPWLDQAMADLKDQYGFGKFGPPHGPNKDDTDEPFRRVAFQRWFADQTVGIIKRFHDTSRRLAPDLLVLGPDISFLRFARYYAYSRYEPYLDAFSGQLVVNNQIKIVGDLLGKTRLWPCNHWEGRGMANEVVGHFSANILNGADGFDIWPHGGAIYLGETRVSTQSMYWSHRPRWDAHLYVCRLLKDQPQLKRPEPDLAVLFSNVCDDPHRSFSRVDKSLYELTGPKSGAWARYVSDYQIEDARVALGDYKAVFVPYANIELESVAKAMREYAEKGGNLVVCDPDAFSFRVDGAIFPGFEENVMGVRRGKTENRKGDASFVITAAGQKWLARKPSQSFPIPLQGDTLRVRSIEPTANTEVLATFHDGTPAMLVHEVGRGRCFYFAFNPCSPEITANRDWVFMFRSFLDRLGVRTNQDIWRFQMPLTSDETPPPSPDLDCLTGNHYTFYFHDIHGLEANVATGGAYRYSSLPDRIPDEGSTAGQWIPFTAGDLTDRPANLNPTNSTKGVKRDQWVVEYGPGEPFSITFDLKQIYELHNVRLLFQGSLPTFAVEFSDNGTDWSHAATSRTQQTDYVGAYELPILPANARFARLAFSARAANLTLVETELWGRAEATTPRRVFQASQADAAYEEPKRVAYPDWVNNTPVAQRQYLINLKPFNEPSPSWLPPGQTWASMNGDVTLMTSLEHEGGLVYSNSLYAQARTHILYRLPPGAKTFVAAAGLGASDQRSSVVFHVVVDKEKRFISDVYRCGQPVLPIVVDVSGGKLIRLYVEDAGDGVASDYAWWGDAFLIMHPQ
ncbi:MAG: NPCBM/NEW2 domain-containing protein [Kiritimatiellia bacterium]